MADNDDYEDENGHSGSPESTEGGFHIFKDEEGTRRTLPSDTALPLVMLERCLKGRARIFFGAPQLCVLIRVPSADWIDPVSRVALHIASWDHVVAAKKSLSKSDSGELAITRLARGGRVLCISVSPERFLPAALTSAADIDVSLGRPDDACIRRTIRAVTGSRVRQVPRGVAAGLDFNAIAAAIRLGSSPKSCIDRLVAASKAGFKEDTALKAVPLLHELHGYGEAMGWATQLVEDLDAWRAGLIDFAEIQRTAVLASPPGLGKTTFARSLAKTAGLPFFPSSVGTWFSQSGGYLDSVIKEIDALFNAAAAAAPAMIFLDELEAVPNRATLDSRHGSWWTPVVTHLLTTLDGATSAVASRLIVVGATNHWDRLDAALVRPGRLSRIIHIGPPDEEALAGIIRQHLGTELPTADLRPLATLGAGASGADVVEWVKRARAAARSDARLMTVDDLRAQIAPTLDYAGDMIRRIALHEAGHAVAAVRLGVGELDTVSLAARGSSGGRTRIRLDESLLTREESEAIVTYILAGRCAEQVLLGSASSGSGGGMKSDLGRATQIIAINHVCMGMGARLIHRGEPADAVRILALDPLLQKEVEQDLRRLETRATEIVRENSAVIEAVADALRVRRVMVGKDLLELIDQVDRQSGSHPRG